MDRMIRIDGTLAACHTCSGQPKHFETRMRGGLHHLECPACRVRTARFPTFQQAVEAWEAKEMINYKGFT